MYVLDTNTLIYYFKGQGQVAQTLGNISPQEIAISTIVFYELQVGIIKSTSPAKRQAASPYGCSVFTVRTCGGVASGG
ncbi:MAG: PIN domain-containing protein [Plectolyngbya sp. WJT66-NPBG17]|jgi:tRNA(fMet)-specific endonuclease VapC|nr:PIN domain-containing protein [Plectolyngbya sp. WJT66-NPBG17]MBW4528154.1 PIN domain-containing protein [Phormidium tanganyikae FI6-MK23]